LPDLNDIKPRSVQLRVPSSLDFFENEKVNADTLLQGMFGQTQGIGSTSISKSNKQAFQKK